MRFTLLASGSKGNCCVIQHEDATIVIDCGSTQRYLEKQFKEIEVDYQKVDALLITHMHKDHTSQLKMFDHVDTYCSVVADTDCLNVVEAYEQFQIKNLKVQVIPLSHDSEKRVGYIIRSEQEKLVYITDTGYVANDVKALISGADYYIFESNHDVEMLMATKRPYFIKQRIISDIGHLCNEDSANILSQVIAPEKTKEIVLAHISREGNTTQLAYDTLVSTLQRKGIDATKMRIHAAQQFGIYQGGL